MRITFEGPETEAMVDKQIDMLSAALAKKPQGLGFAALDSKAAIPLLKRRRPTRSRSSPSTPASTATFRSTTCTTDNIKAAGDRRRQDGGD